VRNYAQVNQAAVREMHRKVGDQVINAGGLAEHGLLVRRSSLQSGRRTKRSVSSHRGQ
jgi:putative pyruvate formate lyase activating enzyme